MPNTNREFKAYGLVHCEIKNGKYVRLIPWIGDLVAPIYDRIMVKSVFPRKFNASYEKHNAILVEMLKKYHQKKILDIASGTGSIIDILPKDNELVLSDISYRLLKVAEKKIKMLGGRHFLYIANAQDLPFSDNEFDVVICNLALNFFTDIEKAITEMQRVLIREGEIVGSVPISDRNSNNTKIAGTLYQESGLAKLFEKHGFKFKIIDKTNGILLYFKAEKVG